MALRDSHAKYDLDLLSRYPSEFADDAVYRALVCTLLPTTLCARECGVGLSRLAALLAGGGGGRGERLIMRFLIGPALTAKNQNHCS